MSEYFLKLDMYNFNTEEEYNNYMFGGEDNTNSELDTVGGDVLEKKRQL